MLLVCYHTVGIDVQSLGLGLKAGLLLKRVVQNYYMIKGSGGTIPIKDPLWERKGIKLHPLRITVKFVCNSFPDINH